VEPAVESRLVKQHQPLFIFHVGDGRAVVPLEVASRSIAVVRMAASDTLYLGSLPTRTSFKKSSRKQYIVITFSDMGLSG
jgi:hypothetical protein